MRFDPEYAPPPYNDLDEANEEIRRLQKLIFLERTTLAKKVESFELTKRSLLGIIKKLNDEASELSG